MTNYATQQQNDDMMSLIASQFRLLYNPTHAFADAIPMMLSMRATRGIWPFTSLNENGNAFDLSGQGRTLTNTGGMGTANNGLAVYSSLNGSTQYWTRAHETGLNPTTQLTVFGWFWFDVLVASTQYTAISKWSATLGNSSYLLDYLNAPRFLVTDGVSAYTAASTKQITTSQWVFLAGRFQGSTVVDITVGNDGIVTTQNTTSIPATINNATTTPFQIGAKNGANLMDGRAAYCHLSAVYLSDAVLNTFYQMTAPLFNVSI